MMGDAGQIKDIVVGPRGPTFLHDLKLVIEEALRERGRDPKVPVNTGFCCS
jgi:hypothetical protein